MSRLHAASAATLVLGLLAGSSAAVMAQSEEETASSAASPVAAPSATAPGDPWADDLALIDREVRARHPGPFVINPESAWVAKLAELRTTLPTATADEQLVQLASLVGLLDSHSYVFGPVHLYGVWAYRFPEGWFVVRANDPSLVGARLDAIGSTPIEEVESALRPLVPSDNESGELIGLQDLLSTAEVLHGLGIVDDPTRPSFVFEQPDGARVTVDLTPEPVDGEWASSLIGYLMGDATEAVTRRGEPVWTHLDEPSKTFLISYNDYTQDDLGPALTEMKAALDAGLAERVLIDMRYIRGGNGSLAWPLIEGVKEDERVNRPGGLTVLIGRENSSAGTVVAGAFDRETEAVLIGEPTPARADNFLCDCYEIPLHDSDFVFGIPTQYLANGDERDAVTPDILLELTAADFFAGRDPALDLALSGPLPSPAA
jgi:hypothetical protein